VSIHTTSPTVKARDKVMFRVSSGELNVLMCIIHFKCL